MNSIRWTASRLLLVFAALPLAAGGCGEPRKRAFCSSRPSPIHLEVSVGVEGEQTVVEVEARNVSDQAVYVCETPAMVEEDKREGPYIFYGGNNTLVLYWATTEHSRWTGGHHHREGAYVRRVESGGSVTLRAELAPECKGQWPWSETMYCDHEAFFGDKDEDLTYRVDRVLVIVAYWEEAAFLKKDPWMALEELPDGSSLISQKPWVPLANLPSASYQALVGRKALRLEPLDPCVTVKDIELLAQAGPCVLPKRLTIRYWGARWPELTERSGGQSPPISSKSRVRVPVPVPDGARYETIWLE
jgi:hypothetical protein